MSNFERPFLVIYIENRMSRFAYLEYDDPEGDSDELFGIVKPGDARLGLITFGHW